MGRKRWNKTTLEWNFPLWMDTDIPVSDWKDDTPHVHKLHGAVATSLPDRRGEILLDIRRVAISATKEAPIILERLKAACREYRESQRHALKWAPKVDRTDRRWFRITFALDHEGYCDVVIRIMKKVFEALGIEDPSDYSLANFSLEQTTMVKFENTWIGFPNSLRIKHRLPTLE